MSMGSIGDGKIVRLGESSVGINSENSSIIRADPGRNMEVSEDLLSLLGWTEALSSRA